MKLLIDKVEGIWKVYVEEKKGGGYKEIDPLSCGIDRITAHIELPSGLGTIKFCAIQPRVA